LKTAKKLKRTVRHTPPTASADDCFAAPADEVPATRLRGYLIEVSGCNTNQVAAGRVWLYLSGHARSIVIP
jgi:hypothetical protein